MPFQPDKLPNTSFPKCLMIAAGASASGKTLITMGLLRAFRNRGLNLAPAKSGPDYIDPIFHRYAAHHPSVNLDCLAMGISLMAKLLKAQESDYVLIEGAMGLYDGSDYGAGSAYQLAEIIDSPIILIMNAKSSAQSAVAQAAGLCNLEKKGKKQGRIKGIIFNQVRSPRHQELIEQAVQAWDIPYLGSLPFMPELSLPSRHLGLVQAEELTKDNLLEPIIVAMAELISQRLDLDWITKLFVSPDIEKTVKLQPSASLIPPPAQRIAVATDTAFAFCYPHILMNWKDLGAQIMPFSPLLDQAPDPSSEFIYLPGGYPELFAEQISQSHNFMQGLRTKKDQGAMIYGECGGYMVLGNALIDQKGVCHPMAGLLPLETSFKERKLTLGYRQLHTLGETPFGFGKKFIGHEFHYSSQINHQPNADALFEVTSPKKEPLGAQGMRLGKVTGSYHHLIASK